MLNATIAPTGLTVCTGVNVARSPVREAFKVILLSFKEFGTVKGIGVVLGVVVFNLVVEIYFVVGMIFFVVDMSVVNTFLVVVSVGLHVVVGSDTTGAGVVVLRFFFVVVTIRVVVVALFNRVVVSVNVGSVVGCGVVVFNIICRTVRFDAFVATMD